MNNLPQLEALLKAYGLEDVREGVADALPYGENSLMLVDILNVMARMGYTGRPLQTRLCDLDARLMPCAFIEQKTLKLRAVTEKSSETAIGTAYIFTKQERKDPKEQKEDLQASGRGWFMHALSRFRGAFWKIGGLSFALNIVALGLPLFMMTIYNRISDITSAQTILLLGIGAVIVLLAEICLRSARSTSLAWFAARIDNIVSNRVLSRLLQMPTHAIERASVASQVARLRSFDSVRDFFTGPLFLTLLDLPFTFIALGLLAWLGGLMAWIPIALLLLYGGITWFFRARLKLSMFQSARARSQTQTHHIELFGKIEALRLNGMNEVWREQFRDLSADGSLSSFQAQYQAQVLETVIYMLTTLAGLLVIYMGVERTWAGAMTGGALFASLLLFWRMIAPWQTLVSNLPRLEQLYRSIQQIDRLMALDTERESALALGKTSNMQGAVEFSKVGLRYSKDNDPVFVGLTIKAEIGELIAIAGGNGSGKSTVLKLALGLYRPQAGAIYHDGRDIRQLDPQKLRRSIAYVPQIPELFEGTIADNLRLGNPFASDRELWHGLELSDAKYQIERMEQGIHTPILKGSDRLRSDLAYRLILARAYIKDAPLMLIDEMPYAILNSRTGAYFVERLKEWRGKKTILMVSHRDDHIALCDHAVGLLSGGKTIFGAPQLVISNLRDEAFKERRKVA